MLHLTLDPRCAMPKVQQTLQSEFKAWGAAWELNKADRSAHLPKMIAVGESWQGSRFRSALNICDESVPDSAQVADANLHAEVATSAASLLGTH